MTPKRTKKVGASTRPAAPAAKPNAAVSAPADTKNSGASRSTAPKTTRPGALSRRSEAEANVPPVTVQAPPPPKGAKPRVQAGGPGPPAPANWIECFIVSNGICIGKSGRFYVNIR